MQIAYVLGGSGSGDFGSYCKLINAGSTKPTAVSSKKKLELVLVPDSTSDKPSESTTERRQRSRSLSKLPNENVPGPPGRAAPLKYNHRDETSLLNAHK